jgi:hypothetical protein
VNASIVGGMRFQGRYRGPYGNHDDRMVPAGRPASLVRDKGTRSYDYPPGGWRPEWRWWTVCLPGLLALAVADGFLGYAVFASAVNCAGGCRPATGGLPVGAAGEVITVIGAVTVLVGGLITPAWRRACAAGLWAALVLACVCAALIAAAHPAAPAGPAVSPSVPAAAAPSLDAAACTAIGGRVAYSTAACFGVPYVGDNGQRDYGEVWYGRDGQLAGPAKTVGTGATRAECQSGKYPDGPAGPVTRQPGRWNAQLAFCMP